MTARAPAKRETWADWLANVKETISEEDLIKDLNRRETITIGLQDLRDWEAKGYIPAPIPSARGPRYPYVATLVILRLHEALQAGRSPSWIREQMRRRADVFNRTTEPLAQTWWDWFPDEDVEKLMTLDALLEELHSLGLTDITARKLRSWQEARVLPLPIRRWRDDATRALFPRRAIPVIQELVTLQSLGYPLQTIRERLRGSAAIQFYPDPQELREAATALARRHQELTGQLVQEVEVRFLTGAEGQESSYVYDVESTTD